MSSLRSKGCEVTVLTGQPNYPDGQVFAGYSATGIGRQIHADGYEIFRVPLIPRGNARSIRLALNYLSFVLSGSVLGPWLLRGRDFDVIFVFGTSPILQAIPAIALKPMKRAKLALWVQDLWPQSLEVTGHVKNKTVLQLAGGLVRWIYGRSDLLLGQSHAFIDALRPMAGNVPVKYHPNPADLSFADKTDLPPPYRLQPGFNIVVAGNMGSAQAPETLVEAARLLGAEADIRVVLFGSGSRWDWVRAEAERLGLGNIEFAGRFPPETMPSLLAQASAGMVLLGKGEILTQTIPSKIPTYMAAGLPIIGSIDGEGARVIAESGAGLATPAEDAAALADAIRQMRLLPDGQLRAMGRAGAAYCAANFAPDRLAKNLIGHFNALLGNDMQAPPRGKTVNE
ncbi:MAG: glycosyltransferase family 4 protein [Candidatus Devosia euplotis]|nr:glycosyltransferase family 4 protein [Candidatus Devosia euplotis]